MADSANFSLLGIDELRGKLDAATDDMKYRGGRFALRKAAQVIRDAAKRNAERLDDPTTAENIAANIVERWSGKRFKATGDLMFRVGVLGGARQYADSRENRRKRRAGETYVTDGSSTNPGGDTYYWRHVELGTERSRAQPFMRSAMDNNINLAIDTFITNYDAALGRALARAKKKSSP